MKLNRILICMIAAVFAVSSASGENSGGRTEYVVEDAALQDSFEVTYPEGQYKCGFDIDEGEYVLISTKENSYFSVLADANGTDILFNGLFSGNSIVTIHAGEYIELEKCFAVPSDEFYARYYNDRSAEGVMLKVGEAYDILPGEYKLTALQEDAYYALYGSSIHSDIIVNKIFDNSSYVTIDDGEYLELDGCVIDGGVPAPTPSPSPAPTPEPTPEPAAASAQETARPDAGDMAEESAEEPSVVYEPLQLGDKGEKVRVLQSKLISGGYLSGAADGNFGSMTEAAVKEYQMANGLEITGIADDEMQQILFKVEPIDLSQMHLKVGSQGDEVRAAQERLLELNYSVGSADGAYGNRTAGAVKDYQYFAGLPVTGEIDEATWNSMFSDDAPVGIAYRALEYKELSRNPAQYEDQYYKFDGVIAWSVENVNTSDTYVTVTMGVNTKGRYDDDVYIEYDRQEGDPRFLEGDKVTIYGRFIGLYSYSTVSNTTRTIPRFEILRIELR